ncbi:MAG TPA: ribosome biogenesis GTPase YlqF [Gammaproteobacteria bacterium]|nr:ribosome biogenesis GTPase YlqF [Gammaproteobacteria bacterium]MDP6733830.1 ribosome biogenesis GTPase YlqF [Gammaproteobacteria bacterium]HAJ76633.1 ribosome biogenesis GTPase YlqF [Gammaproteobacteria bacterium]
MSISWYPGHMHKASKELVKLMRSVDAVIEVLDARAPQASCNPLLSDIRKQLPCIKILNKADLAEAQTTDAWQDHFNTLKQTICLTSGSNKLVDKSQLIDAAERLLARDKPANMAKFELAIIGIPNVGKSTLLNILADRKLARTGNEPAVTRSQQRIKLADNKYLVDTPGMMWPKLEDQAGAYKLAMLGSIRNTAVSADDIAWFAAELLLSEFRDRLVHRYDLAGSVQAPQQLLEQVAEIRGCLTKGGKVDFNKASEALLNDMRSGKLGQLSLERPPV